MSGLPSSPSPVGPFALPLARWTKSRSDIHLEADASQSPLLQEADVVGTVAVDGHADVNPREIIVSLQVHCTTREICGRSLEEFEHPLDFPVQILLRRSNSVLEFQWEEDGDEAFEATISEHLRELDISEILRQAVVLERPISPIKPGTPLPEGVLPEDDLEKPIDPRWDTLRQFRDSEN